VKKLDALLIISYFRTRHLMNMNLTKTNYLKFSAVAAYLAFTIVSCKPDSETSLPTPTDKRDNLVGDWHCAETSKQNGNTTFTVKIKKDENNKNQILMDNFSNYGFNKSLYATVSGYSISIPEQTYADNKVSGSGKLSTDNQIELTYTVNDGSGTASGFDSCTAKFTK